MFTSAYCKRTLFNYDSCSCDNKFNLIIYYFIFSRIRMSAIEMNQHLAFIRRLIKVNCYFRIGVYFLLGIREDIHWIALKGYALNAFIKWLKWSIVQGITYTIGIIRSMGLSLDEFKYFFKRFISTLICIDRLFCIYGLNESLLGYIMF